jgi:hypothetical protein
MTDRILLPAGMLPPGEWAVGARVDIDGDRGAVVGAFGPHVIDVRYPDVLLDEARATSRLDITSGPLDFGTRALWHALGLGEQPLTAPGWALGYGPMGAFGWGLVAAERSPSVWVSPQEWRASDDPRRALQFACEAVWAERT